MPVRLGAVSPNIAARGEARTQKTPNGEGTATRPPLKMRGRANGHGDRSRPARGANEHASFESRWQEARGLCRPSPRTPTELEEQRQPSSPHKVRSAPSTRASKKTAAMGRERPPSPTVSVNDLEPEKESRRTRGEPVDQLRNPSRRARTRAKRAHHRRWSYRGVEHLSAKARSSAFHR